MSVEAVATAVDVPAVAFLGFVERASYVSDAGTDLYKYNLLGFKHILLSHIYPLPLRGLSAAFAVYQPSGQSTYHIVLLDECGAQVGRIDMAFCPKHLRLVRLNCI